MKYKLIKKYPTCNWELGDIITLNNGYYTGKNYNFYESPSNYPEFWELVVEKDYEILTYQQQNGNQLFDLQDNGRYKTRLFNLNIEFEEAVFNKNNPIISIKRLSDGEIFTIGDKTGTPGNIYPIAEFKISDTENTILVSSYYENGRSGGYNIRLKNVIKSKTVLFKTEDGVDIFEDKEFNCVNQHLYLFKEKGLHCIYLGPHIKIFSTKEAAEEYILLNKPVLSLNDYYSLFDEDIYDYGIGEKLKKLVKQKLK